MYIIFLTMLLIFMLLSQINTALRKKKSKDAVRTEKKQGKRYYRAMAWMWGPAIVVITISLIGGISLADLGLRGISFTYNIWFTAIVLVVSGLMLVVSLRTLILSLASKKFIEKMRTEIERDDVARDILPRTKKEKCQYIMLSFSSGICEELVYRGFMAFLLQAVFPEIPIFLIILITSVLFGIGHLYQGWQGVLQTGVVGAIFMSLLLVTNSLILVMALHFITNASDAFLLNEATKKSRYTTWQNMRYFIGDTWRKEKTVILVVIAQIFLAVALALVGIFLPATVVQQITFGVEIQTLIITILAFTVVTIILQTIDNYLESSADGRRERILLFAICDAMEKTMHTDYANLEHQSFTDAQQKAVGQVLNGSSYMAIWQCFKLFGAGILGFFIYIAVLSVVHPWVFLLSACTCIIGVVARHRVNLWWHKNEDRQAEPGKRIRNINNMSERQGLAKDLRLFAMTRWIKELFTANMNMVYSFRKQGEMRNALAGAADALAIFVREGITYIYLIGLVLSGEITPDTFVLLFAAVAGFSGWISDILREWVELSRHGMNIGRMREFLEYPDTFKRVGGAEIPKATAYTLELRNVSFQYQGAENNTIENINLHIKPGEKLAIVGLNGAGKTTLVKLLCGLYDPTAGAVLLNGIDIREFNRDEYYALFTAVFQEFNILPTTISDNIIQDTTCDKKRVQDATRLADIQRKIASLPNGLDSFLIKEVHLDGEELSGGETQRLMLARALYKNAPILILDEPTAALDPIAENELYNRYAELSKGRTSVYISHRLASTRFCERIILIDNKGIAEEGTHDELIKKGEKYAELYEIQSKYYREGVVF